LAKPVTHSGGTDVWSQQPPLQWPFKQTLVQPCDELQAVPIGQSESTLQPQKPDRPGLMHAKPLGLPVQSVQAPPLVPAAQWLVVVPVWHTSADEQQPPLHGRVAHVASHEGGARLASHDW
jgi:hypothetical protein